MAYDIAEPYGRLLESSLRLVTWNVWASSWWRWRGGGAGHPVHCEVIGTQAVDGVLPSDHYGVLADLRY